MYILECRLGVRRHPLDYGIPLVAGKPCMGHQTRSDQDYPQAQEISVPVCFSYYTASLKTNNTHSIEAHILHDFNIFKVR